MASPGSNSLAYILNRMPTGVAGCAVHSHYVHRRDDRLIIFTREGSGPAPNRGCHGSISGRLACRRAYRVHVHRVPFSPTPKTACPLRATAHARGRPWPAIMRSSLSGSSGSSFAL
jgi:hypothetical protein